MVNKIDGVNIPVKKSDKKGGGQKSTAKIKKTRKKSTPSKEQNIVKNREQSQKKPNTGKKIKKKALLSSVAMMAITAILAGGAIYAWQNNAGKKDVNEVQEEARSIRLDFEQRLSKLKNKISGFETENLSLKESAKELEEKAKLLVGAKKEFRDDILGIAFEYPAIFGEVIIKNTEGKEGNSFVASFSKLASLSFGGVDNDYESLSTTTAPSFLASRGYYKRSGKYYFQASKNNSSLNYQIEPEETLELKNDVLALVVNKNSFVATKDDIPAVEIGENLGALVNLESGAYRGLSFLNEDFSSLSFADFLNIIKTIEIIEQ